MKTHYLRDHTTDRHQTVDEKPYGGGVGLLFKADIMMKALNGVLKGNKKKTRVILTAANGKRFTQKDAERLAQYDRLVFVCPRYEGADARIEKMVDEKLSIGDFVLTGGELAAATVIDAVSRQIPGFVGKEESVKGDSFSDETNLEYPQYTRPEVLVYKGKKLRVPKVLLSGHHGKINEWRLAHTKHRSKKLES